MKAQARVEIAEAAESPSIDQCGLTLETAAAALAGTRPVLPVRFRFRWREIKIEAEVRESGDRVVLRQSLDLAPVPYSAENPGGRRYLRGLAAHGVPVGRFAIGPKQRLALHLESPLEAPITGGAIVVAATRALLEAAPYLRLARP
jgi:hypothetical protein